MTRAQAVTSLWMVRGGLGARPDAGLTWGKLPELTAEDSAQRTVQMCVLYCAIQYFIHSSEARQTGAGRLRR